MTDRALTKADRLRLHRCMLVHSPEAYRTDVEMLFAEHAALREVARAANVMLLELGASKLRFTNGEVVSFRDAKVTFGPKTSAVVDALAALEAAHPGVLAREG